MGTSGRKPLPTALRNLRGGKVRKVSKGLSAQRGRPSRAPSAEVPEEKQPAKLPIISGAPESCQHDAVAARTYKELVKMLRGMKVLSGNDLKGVEAMALAYARAIECEKHVAQHGAVTSGFMGFKANPAVAMARAQWQEVRKWSVEFGMTPSARTRVAQLAADGDPEKGSTEDAHRDFLFGKGGRVIGAIGA